MLSKLETERKRLNELLEDDDIDLTDERVVMQSQILDQEIVQAMRR